jgi:hypothetical protein
MLEANLGLEPKHVATLNRIKKDGITPVFRDFAKYSRRNGRSTTYNNGTLTGNATSNVPHLQSAVLNMGAHKAQSIMDSTPNGRTSNPRLLLVVAPNNCKSNPMTPAQCAQFRAEIDDYYDTLSILGCPWTVIPAVIAACAGIMQAIKVLNNILLKYC